MFNLLKSARNFKSITSSGSIVGLILFSITLPCGSNYNKGLKSSLCTISYLYQLSLTWFLSLSTKRVLVMAIEAAISDCLHKSKISDIDHTWLQSVLIHAISNGIEEDSFEIVQLPLSHNRDLFKPFVSTKNFKKYCSKLNVQVKDIEIDWSLGDPSLCKNHS